MSKNENGLETVICACLATDLGLEHVMRKGISGLRIVAAFRTRFLVLATVPNYALRNVSL